MPSALLFTGGDALPVVEDPRAILGFLRAPSAHPQPGLPLGWMQLTSPAEAGGPDRHAIYVDVSRVVAIERMTNTQLEEIENEF